MHCKIYNVAKKQLFYQNQHYYIKWHLDLCIEMTCTMWKVEPRMRHKIFLESNMVIFISHLKHDWTEDQKEFNAQADGVPELVCQRVHYGPLDAFAKSENYRERGHNFWTVLCTWRALCSKSLLMDHVRVVVQTAYFFWGRSLNNCHFCSCLNQSTEPAMHL